MATIAGQAAFRGVQDFLLRHPFRTFVVANHFFELRVGRFIGKLRAVDGDGRDRAGVDQLLNAGALCGIQKIFCAADVRIVNVLLAPGPQAVIRRNVEDAFHAS